MKLNGIRTIALLVAATVLVIGSVGGMVVAGAEDRSSDEGFRSDEGWRMDARYWWEVPPVTAYEREQIREIMTLVLDRYFGIDISAMSPEEFEEMGQRIGPKKEAEALRLFEHYAKQRGFQIPPGIFEMPRMPREIPAPLEFTPPPPPRLRLAEELKEWGTIAIFGRLRTYDCQVEIQEWLDRLYKVQNLVPWSEISIRPYHLMLGHRGGYLWIVLNQDKITIDQALSLVRKTYAVIAEKAETLGIEEVPVVFGLQHLQFRPHLPTQKVPPQTALPVCPNYVGKSSRPDVIGGVQMQIRDTPGSATTGFAVWNPIPWWPDDVDYVITGHFYYPPPGRTPVGARVYQPTVARGNEAGIVEDVGRRFGFADVARVGICNWHVAPYIRDMFITRPVRNWRDDPDVGMTVRMSGIATFFSEGQVIATNIDVPCPNFGTLRRQVLANYRAALGDSGAPVYRVLPCDGVEILGIQSGNLYLNGVLLGAIFSPISGVRIELPGWYPHTK